METIKKTRVEELKEFILQLEKAKDTATNLGLTGKRQSLIRLIDTTNFEIFKLTGGK